MFFEEDRPDPSKYIGTSNDGRIKKTFGDNFRVDANQGLGGQYPWNPARFTGPDILNYAQSRKRTFNAHLGMVDPEAPLDHQLFIGLGKFTRQDYDFQAGRPQTDNDPKKNPDFNPVWVQAYKISPTIPPGKRAKNRMPTASNPDPNGYIMQLAESQANNDVQGEPSVASLLSSKKLTSVSPPAGGEIPEEPPKEVKAG